MQVSAQRLPILDDASCGVCGLNQKLEYGRTSVRIIAESDAMRQLLIRVARIAPTDASVLLTGESGTGKEVVARAIHDGSLRKQRPFVAVNCAALPPDLLESELFGHARGSFSGAAGSRKGLFEEAHGGSLFLDEIGELPQGLQAKLLRALQEGEVRRVGENQPIHVDVRVIAATNSDLPAVVAAGGFRKDLYYRLKVFGLELPPLGQRLEDVIPMARAFLELEAAGLRFSPEAEEALLAWSWPGNVRELRNAVRHGAVLADGPLVQVKDLPPEFAFPARGCPVDRARQGVGARQGDGARQVEPESSRGMGAGDEPGPGTRQVDGIVPGAGDVSMQGHGHGAGHHLAGFSATASLDDVIRAHALAAVEACAGNRAAAARALGVGRNTLWRWLKSDRTTPTECFRG